MSELEYCIECGDPTGRAGPLDDSLYPGGEGPYCEDCFSEWPDWKVSEIADLRQQLAELKSTLENYEALKRMHRLENYPNELAARAWLLRKQAEAVEDAVAKHEIKSATDDSKCYSVALRDYARRLRQQADAAERAGGEK